ncbi:MAG: tRNA (guanosine(46)-N7)-methyltransferase TrmB [Clostridia bacterium]|nr:tRNA (guanosine(46)-N7)-methyltransferase TrmB [Clostridia bacterium]
MNENCKGGVMRLRKKKNLEDRIKDCGDILLVYEQYGFYKLPEQDRYSLIDTEKVFGNNNSVYLEIGSGKGGFITEMALKHPEINFLGVEKISNVLICAMEKALSLGLTNVKFLNCDASNLNYYIKDNSVSRLFLNFSCPWPKHKYENQRLTNPRFLRIYEKLLTSDADIIQKTDSAQMFEYSVMTLSQYGFGLYGVTCDLHNSEIKNEVMTEYEKYFSGIGKPIFRLQAKLNKFN